MATYITIADVESIFGEDNIERWSDVDNDANATKITNRQTRAMDLAEEYINTRLRHKGYDIPFTAPIPKIITDITAKQAGYELYMARGIVDADPNQNSLIPIRNDVERVIGQIMSGVLRLDTSTAGVSNRDDYIPVAEAASDIDDSDALDGVYVE